MTNPQDGGPLDRKLSSSSATAAATASSSSQGSPTSPVRTFAIPKNRSAGNLHTQNPPSQFELAPPGRAASFDASFADTSVSGSSTSPILHESQHGLAPSGLHRIRQKPQLYPLVPPDSQNRATSMTLPMPTPRTPGTSSVSPVLSATDDLMRFPSESLHSFSFAQKSDDFMQVRSNVLKRTLDLMRDRGAWAATGLGIANAQAKISGDQDVQGMMDLLNKANLLPKDANPTSTAPGFALGPITGPPQTSAENVFEKSFMGRSESPTEIEPSSNDLSDPTGDPTSKSLRTPSLTVEDVEEEAVLVDDEQVTPQPFTSVKSERPSLKRTYTDTDPLSIQEKLTEAMAQPYLADENTLLPPTNTAAVPTTPSIPLTPFPSFQPHAHGRAGPPVSQAFFTTESRAPWTIVAANDLACLIFGVSKGEFRKIGILEMVREDKRKWLESKLATRQPDHHKKPQSTPSALPRSSILGNGVTARLLSKPSSRETGQGRRTKSDDGSGSSVEKRRSAAKAAPNHPSNRSRGVLLCGDVVPILKRNGDVSSATVWVQEKRESLIWVLEEVAEDMAILQVDEIGCVAQVSGDSESIWGMERVRSGMDVARLIPEIPRRKGTNTGALDFDMISELRGFTARTANDISIPITIERLSEDFSLRVSSFPHIAGMMVISSSSLNILSSNSVVSEALFGQVPNGLRITELIPGFDNMLNLLVQEDTVELIEGIVVPEHSFRRARSMLAIREGRAEAAAVFLRPSGVPAVHRDGAEIMIDIQMRVVKNEAYNQDYRDTTIPEHDEEDNQPSINSQPSELVYAVWVTYSRSTHAVNHGVGPITPLVSRPGTPPQQPSPGTPILLDDSDSDGSKTVSSRPTTARGPKDKQPETQSSTSREPSDSTSASSASAAAPHKKSISDYVILEDMGAGAYGQVKLARPKANPSKKVVIKYVTKRRILVDTWTRDRRLGTVPLEIHVLDYLRRDGFKHPNIVEMIDFFEDDINYYIEMVPHGLPGMDLFDYIELRVNMEEDECRRIFAQVASAIEFLHLKAKVVHRDIKDENLILDGEGRIKLIDFGSACYIKSGPFDVFVGTIDYAAPEVLRGKSYSGPPQDIWALGILLYTILYKENPFYSIDEIMDLDLRIPYIVSESSIDLVRGMLQRDLDQRMNIEDVIAHPWCAGTAETDGLPT